MQCHSTGRTDPDVLFDGGETMLETELFDVLKPWFEDRGFDVQAELNGIDLVASNDDTMIVVEGKTSLTMTLLYQGCERQTVCDKVYLAVPPIRKKRLLKERLHLLKRLHLGLLFVDVETRTVEAILDPSDYVVRRSKKKRTRLLTEMRQRSSRVNVGGSTGRKLVTSYRETAIRIAFHLSDGPKSIRDLREQVPSTKLPSILQKNYYHWFERVQRGVYSLTDDGREALSQYRDLFDALGLNETE